MTVDHVKSTPVTNLDATPRVPMAAGEGAPGYLQWTEGYATALASSSVDATYQLVRLPSNAKVKQIIFDSEAQTAGKFDIGGYYATDGSKIDAATALLAAAAIDQDRFATAIDCAAAVVRTDILNESGTVAWNLRGKMLWEMLGLTADPACNIDIVATVVTTAVTTGTGKFGIAVGFTM